MIMPWVCLQFVMMTFLDHTQLLFLTPSDYYLFRNLKSHLRGMRFRYDDELKATIEAWFADQTDDLFERHRLIKRKLDQCSEVKGDFIEKITLKPSFYLLVKPQVLRTFVLLLRRFSISYCLLTQSHAN